MTGPCGFVELYTVRPNSFMKSIVQASTVLQYCTVYTHFPMHDPGGSKI